MPDRRALAAALVGFVAVATAPLESLSSPGQYALATGALAGVLWVTGGLPLPITALTIPVFLLVFGVAGRPGEAVSGFADPIIFLVLSGFVLAAALQKHDIDRRIAYHVLRAVGTSPRGVVLAVMLATATLSMVISNSATTAMMVPIALGIVDRLAHDGSTPAMDGESTLSSPSDGGSREPIRPAVWRRRADQPNIRLAMLLGVAYAASIGGVGTLIGTPPNAIVASQLSEQLGYTVTFVDWLFIGLPFVVVGLPLAWYVLAVVVYPPAVTDASPAREEARRYLHERGAPSGTERHVLLIVGATATLWLLGGLGFLFEGILSPRLYATLFGGSGGHLFGPGGHHGVLYFVTVGLAAIPALAIVGGIDWDDVHRIDWGTLVLLGGGITLANGLAATGATRWLAENAVGSIVGAPALLVLLVVAAATVGVSEIASNTAMAAISVPILISVGPQYAGALGTSPTTASLLLAVTGGVAASFGFALPVATPPNAIAFGAGGITRAQMLRPGAILDAVMVVVTAVLAYLLFTVVWSAIG